MPICGVCGGAGVIATSCPKTVPDRNGGQRMCGICGGSGQALTKCGACSGRGTR